MVYGSEFWAGLHVFSGKDLGMARNPVCLETWANCSGIATRLKQHYYCQEIMTALGDLAQVNEQGSRLINFLRVLKQPFLASCKNQEAYVL